MTLQILWFCLIALLWAGYFVLEGFDFGVGMLLPFAPHDERERSVLFEAIGPVWDGNEVWLVVAGGATFAAFPAWYATMFSGFYLALLLVLLFLMVRVVSFEWRAKGDTPRWRATWLWANAIGSVGAPFVWGVALASLLHGVPLDSKGDYAGSFGDLFTWYTVTAGLAVVALFAFHGASFLALRTVGPLQERVERAARLLRLPALALGGAFLAWTVVVAGDHNSIGPALVCAILAAAALVAAALSRGGRSFALSAVGVVLTVATLFAGLYPRVLVSSPDFGNSLTVPNAASEHYTLVVITVVALVVTPLVLLYQGWTYYVFRARVTGEEIAPPAAT